MLFVFHLSVYHNMFGKATNKVTPSLNVPQLIVSEDRASPQIFASDEYHHQSSSEIRRTPSPPGQTTQPAHALSQPTFQIDSAPDAEIPKLIDFKKKLPSSASIASITSLAKSRGAESAMGRRSLSTMASRNSQLTTGGSEKTRKLWVHSLYQDLS